MDPDPVNLDPDPVNLDPDPVNPDPDPLSVTDACPFFPRPGQFDPNIHMIIG